MRRIGAGAVMTITTLVLLEVFLRLFDPLGVVYFDDKQRMNEVLRADPSGYGFIPGVTLALAHWSFNIDGDGTRYTPGAVRSGPRVAFFGDSVTFCHGVNDADCWVSQVAATLGLDAINYGRTGYAAAGTAALMDAYGPGCAVFLTIVNDAQPQTVVSFSGKPAPAPAALPYLIQYPLWYSYRTTHRYDDTEDRDAYYAAMRAISGRPDTLVLAFADGAHDEAEYGAMVRDRYGAVLIPNYHTSVSWFDGHPDAAGNREIAAGAQDVIADWLSRRKC